MSSPRARQHRHCHLTLVERAKARAGEPALLDLSLLRITSFRYGSIEALIVAPGEFGMLFALPLFVQGVLLLGPGHWATHPRSGNRNLADLRRDTTAHPTPGRSHRRACGALARSRRHHRARPEHHPDHEWLGSGGLAVPLRIRRRPGHRTAHQPDSR